MCFSPQRRAIFPLQNFKKCSETVSFLTFSLANVRFATAACNFSTSELKKVLRDRQFFKIFTCECAFRHSGVQFFDISTSKSGPSMRCFVHFDLQMCVSPQPRAIFRHLNFKKWSEAWVVLYILTCKTCVSPQPRAIFRHLNFKKCSEAWGVLYILTCKMCVLPQRRAIFAFSAKHRPHAPAALTGLLFDWPDTRIIEKKTEHFATSLTFRACASSFFWLSHYCIFFLLTWLLYCFSHNLSTLLDF